jgi:predicted glycogen debranching enzyme
VSELRLEGLEPTEASEWLETDGLGGFASGTTLGLNTRRYHALLLAALAPPAGRHVLVNDAAVWLEGPTGRPSLSSHRFLPDVTALGDARPRSFSLAPWPRFEREVDGVTFWQEITMLHGLPIVLVSWRFERPLPGVTLCVRPLLSGRNFHALQHENPACDLRAHPRSGQWLFQPYAALPAIASLASGVFSASPVWYRQFRYERERERGLDHAEDLASPGVIRFDSTQPRADWIIAVDSEATRAFLATRSASDAAHEIRRRESGRRAAFPSALERAADAYLVQRGSGKTIIAGYPWFGDWGRDTFIALRGLCLATERFAEASEILLAWADSVQSGLLPNRFADDPSEPPEYNSVDAALWYVLAIGELIERHPALAPSDRRALEHAAEQVVAGHLRGTLHGIKVDRDGLLAAGAPGLQLTWMDAKVGERVITSRSGKPVEVQALWLNALAVLEHLGKAPPGWLERGLQSFAARFDPGAGGLFDVVDVDHRPGLIDARMRPNQVLAVGGLPLPLLPSGRCREVLEVVEASLWTPIGLRSLAPSEPGYAAHYAGSMSERDAAYHQGTLWPWLLGPFIEAWVKARGGSPAARSEAGARFVEPWRAHLSVGGVGHVSEIADADPPHALGGCPFQAWSLSELIRVERDVLAARVTEGGSARKST